MLGCKYNREKSSAAKGDEYTACNYSIATVCTVEDEKMSMINIEAKNVLQKILQRPKSTCNKNNYGKNGTMIHMLNQNN